MVAPFLDQPVSNNRGFPDLIQVVCVFTIVCAENPFAIAHLSEVLASYISPRKARMFLFLSYCNMFLTLFDLCVCQTPVDAKHLYVSIRVKLPLVTIYFIFRRHVLSSKTI